MPLSLSTDTVAERFFHPLDQLLPQCEFGRPCPALPDSDWFRLLLGRVLHDVSSGRAFLQQYAPAYPNCPDTSNFFESLKSTRRLALLREVTTRLQATVKDQLPDRLAIYPALDNFDVFAGDGHWHGAAVHDAKVQDTKYATGHFYGLNLRHLGVVHLTSADHEQRLKEHDMRALKRLDIALLRQGAPKTRHVIWVWDKAGIDFRQWHCWKQSAGVYFISRAKENMTKEVVGENPWDKADPINQGILEDVLVATSQGVLVRRVTYRDPLSGELFEFLTNQFDLPPGLIAHLYRLRWEIEKVFDEFKNKLGEKKSWASSPTAKSIHAQFLCLTHTLLLLFESMVAQTQRITNVAEAARREKRVAKIEASLQSEGAQLPSAIRALLRCTQHSVKLIRWLRSSLLVPTSWTPALERLRQLYATL